MTISENEFTDEAAPNSAAPRAVDWENPRVSAILAAAAKCFARNGFSATTLAEIGKELGLRKSIVHYYFASKAALIHEVQSYSYHKYMDRVRAATVATEGSPGRRAITALESLWAEIQQNKTATALNVEVWATARRDPELRRRSAALQRDARALIAKGMNDVLGTSGVKLPVSDEALSTLILAVLNGLALSDYLEGEDPRNRQAFEIFLFLLRLGIKAVETGSLDGAARSAPINARP